MDIKTARPEDISTYVALAQAAQHWLTQQGLTQYVPAAHDAYQEAIDARVDAGTLYAVWINNTAVAFFNLDPTRSPWWTTDTAAALYLSGIVVSLQVWGQQVRQAIVHWCAREAVRCKVAFVRLDCHAENEWLNRYYQSLGFVLQGQVEQHPCYFGCLYQLAAPSH